MQKSPTHWVRHECGSDRVSLGAAQASQRFPVHLVLDNIRSAHNVGSMFRTADGANAASIALCGYTPTPPHPHLFKTALGAVDAVPWLHYADVGQAIAELRAQSVSVLALEKTDRSTPLYQCELKFPLALVLGNEVDGLELDTLTACDEVLHLPMYGHKNSLNVSVACGAALYECLRRYLDLVVD